jgi:hypothetical protein
MVSKGQSPADALLERFDPNAPLVPQLLTHARL